MVVLDNVVYIYLCYAQFGEKNIAKSRDYKTIKDSLPVSSAKQINILYTDCITVSWQGSWWPFVKFVREKLQGIPSLP